jgi:hypothetical protein
MKDPVGTHASGPYCNLDTENPILITLVELFWRNKEMFTEFGWTLREVGIMKAKIKIKM